MIILDLSCKQEHPFEGWFQSLSSFDSQIEAGLISCPHCGSSDIRRVPSVVHMTKTTSAPDSAREAESSAKPSATGSTVDVIAAYEQLLSAIVASSEDVGKDFVEEARRIHYLDAPLRSIRGEASAEEYESLRDEGIDVLRLPLVKKSIN